MDNTVLWRSDVITIAGKDRVEKDMLNHLLYRKLIPFTGQEAYMMTNTEYALVTGERKAIDRIQKHKGGPRKLAVLADSVPAQMGITVPVDAPAAVMQSTIPAPTASQPASVPQPARAQPAANQQGSIQPASIQTTVPQAVPTQSTAPQAVGQNMAQLQLMFRQFLQTMLQQAQPSMPLQQT